MNRLRWSNPNVSLEALALKLSEEAAEVGTEFTDAIMRGCNVNVSAVLEELDHVEFIAAVIRWRTTGEITRADLREATRRFRAGE